MARVPCLTQTTGSCSGLSLPSWQRRLRGAATHRRLHKLLIVLASFGGHIAGPGAGRGQRRLGLEGSSVEHHCGRREALREVSKLRKARQKESTQSCAERYEQRIEDVAVLPRTGCVCTPDHAVGRAARDRAAVSHCVPAAARSFMKSDFDFVSCVKALRACTSSLLARGDFRRS